jgi:CubicO group peptidase (beta-lactamase class C family)
MLSFFRRILGLLAGMVVLAACAGDNAGREPYKYGVASWQGVHTASTAYRHAIAKSRRLITEATRHNGLPGAQIAVAIDGTVCWSENFGYADLGQGRVVQPNTLFRMASVSKMYTAAAVARLVQAHQIDLDAPVVRYLPELPGHYAGITTRHLVSHQAGIRHYYGADRSEKTGHYADVGDALDLFTGAPLLFPPGTDCAYSSYGWVLLSAVVERVSGKPFLRYMREDVWAPLGLGNTFAEIPADRQKDLSTFYLKDHPQGKWYEAPAEDLSFKWAGGGFSSNANDLARFGVGLLDRKFLSAETLSLVCTPQRTATGDTTGFGIGVTIYATAHNRRMVGHSGFMPTARSYLLLFPDDNLVIAFTANTALANFADENLVEMASLFLNEKSNAGYYAFDRALHGPWKGVWRVQLENEAGSFEPAYLNFYEENNELSGTLLFEHSAPRHLEVIRLGRDSIGLLAALPAYTATMELALKGSELTGKSICNKPQTPLLRKRFGQDARLARMLAPKRIRMGKKIR